MNPAAAPPRATVCRHCHAAAVTRPRGLCWSCYYADGVREQYPPAVKLGHCPDGTDQAEGPVPPDPTPHRPGTPAKVAALEARLAAGFALWHPADAQPE